MGLHYSAYTTVVNQVLLSAYYTLRPEAPIPQRSSEQMPCPGVTYQAIVREVILETKQSSIAQKILARFVNIPLDGSQGVPSFVAYFRRLCAAPSLVVCAECSCMHTTPFPVPACRLLLSMASVVLKNLEGLAASLSE